jgi:tetratricopeptide (TPR) repeat protein
MVEQAVQTVSELAFRSTNQDTRARAFLTSGFCLLMSGEFDRGLAAFIESSTLLRATCSDVQLARALNGQALCQIYMGRHVKAVAPLASALKVSHKLNDVGHRATLLSNLGVTYEELGMFAEAETCYLEAIATLAERHPRSAIISHINRAHIALVRGNLPHAAAALAVAKEFASDGQGLRLSTLVDFGQADLLLALGEPERAWPIVARAATHVWGKERSMDTNGKTIRLTLHCALATGGPLKLASLVEELGHAPRPLRLADRLEVAGFLEWAVRQGVLDAEIVRRVGLEIQQGELLGPIGALAAIGTPPSEEWTPLPDESAERMLERLVPRNQRASVMPAVEEIIRCQYAGEEDDPRRAEPLSVRALHG